MKKLLLILLLLLFSTSLFASISFSLSVGADFTHSRLYREEIPFRTAGIISIRSDIMTFPNAKFSINPYVKTNFRTHTLTYNNTRLLGSYDISAGLNSNIKLKESLDLSIYGGVVSGFYRTTSFSNLFWQLTSNETAFLTFVGLEAGIGLLKRFDSVILFSQSSFIYQRDSYHLTTSIGIALEEGAIR